jgi:hypothetical protein
MRIFGAKKKKKKKRTITTTLVHLVCGTGIVAGSCCSVKLFAIGMSDTRALNGKIVVAEEK